VEAVMVGPVMMLAGIIWMFGGKLRFR